MSQEKSYTEREGDGNPEVIYWMKKAGKGTGRM
jgi:hypothetical protein